MEVVTLANEAFTNKCKELISSLNYTPDLMVGILNGGGYVLDELLIEEAFNNSKIKFIKLQRVSWLKDFVLVRQFLKVMPYSITNKLRKMESSKSSKYINSLSLKELSNHKIDFQLSAISKEVIKNILIVDDAIDTGKTMFVVKNNLKRLFPEAQIKIAVISWTIENSIIKPDYFIFKDVLVRFPWSKDYKGKDFEKKSFSS
jgi:hypothetical protein